MQSGPQLILVFLASVAFIIVLTAKVRMHAFYGLLLAAFGVGLATDIPLDDIVGIMKQGFGGTLGNIGIIIICGTTIGVILERTGAAISMAEAVLRIVGKTRAPLAMSSTGFIVGIPIFCDSGFIVLSALNKSLAERSKVSMAVMGVALATAMYSVHCLAPPHPGAAAAAGIIGADVGKVIMLGLVAAVPSAIAGYFWATRMGRKFDVPARPETSYDELKAKYGVLPRPWHAFMPIFIPVGLIALKSIGTMSGQPFGQGTVKTVIDIAGDPSIALIIGVFLALSLVPRWNKEVLDTWLGDGIMNAGVILAITAAGGAFGEILKSTSLGEYLGDTLATMGLGIFLPYMIAAALKTAQGSSTVAIITSASLVAPLLDSLGLAAGWGPTLAVLSMGAGSMMLSHANDSYFWVVSRFSGLEMPIALKVYTTATAILSLTAMTTVFLFSLFLL